MVKIIQVKCFLLLGLFSFVGQGGRVVQPAWNSDAGYIPSYSETATVTTSSNPNDAWKITDGNAETAWQSEAPLPTGFVTRPELNVFLKKNSAAPAATDGQLETSVAVKTALHFPLESALSIVAIGLKCRANAPVQINLEQKNGTEKTFTWLPSDNYQFKRWEVTAPQTVSLRLSSPQAFDVFEIAALATPPTEWAIFDFGNKKPLGTVHTRHWAGHGMATATRLSWSNDHQAWNPIATLDPDVVHWQTIVLPQEVEARYLKIEHELRPADWNKTFLWEVKAYDCHGAYGARPPAQPGHVSLREVLGVNGYWSWGTDKYSDELAPDGGPYRYRPVASHGRNYHDLTWDLHMPGEAMDFEKMAAGGGTPVNAWLNWDREYAAWVRAGLNVQASLQIYKFPPESWKNPEREAYEYARRFARHFGAHDGNGYVCSIEAGNEPWQYPADLYRNILKGMAQGAAAGDPSVEVFPCALQAHDPSAETSGPFKNYIGARITPETAKLLDGINSHVYSYLPGPDGRRKGIYPEHPASTFWEILNMIRWRNANMPGKKIYLSEWGWDSSGAGEDCTHDECVSESAAAAYAVRGALIAARLGLDRATWFYYGNDKSPSSLYTRSGLTGSGKVDFRKKKAFLALQSLVTLAGDCRFLQVVHEDETAWIYLYENQKTKEKWMAAWRPVDGDEMATTSVSLPEKWRPAQAWTLDGTTGQGRVAPLPKVENDRLVLQVSAVPVLVKMKL